MRHAAVEDHRGFDAARRPRRCRSRPWGSCRRSPCRRRSARAPRDGQFRDQLLVAVEHAGDVGQQQQARRAASRRRPRRPTVSALMLKVSPRVADADRRDHRDDVGALEELQDLGVDARGSPTKPRSSSFSILLSGSACGGSACALDQAAVLAREADARAAGALIAAAICLLIEPESTISTISTVAGR